MFNAFKVKPLNCKGLTPEPVIVVTPETFEVSVIFHVMVYPGCVAVIVKGAEVAPLQIDCVEPNKLTVAVGFIVTIFIIESIPQKLAV